MATGLGCIRNPAHTPLGTGLANACANIVGVRPSMHGYLGASCGDACRDQPCAACCGGDEIAEPQHYLTELNPDAGIVSDHEPCGDPACNRPQCLNLRAALAMPRDTFAATANLCIRPIAYAPAEIPPPGRFHPVPTQPVFAPR